jgi:hypothetical protein
MEIQAIKMNKEVTEIVYVQAHGTQTVTSVLVDATTPAPEFVNAFQRLTTLGNEITNGWFKSEAVKKYRVNKIGFKKSEAGALGCYLQCTVEFENSNRPLNLNTQVKYSLVKGTEESEFCLSGKAVDLLNELKSLAQDFMNGVRAQKDLFKNNIVAAAAADHLVNIADKIVEESKPRPINRKKGK